MSFNPNEYKEFFAKPGDAAQLLEFVENDEDDLVDWLPTAGVQSLKIDLVESELGIFTQTIEGNWPEKLGAISLRLIFMPDTTSSVRRLKNINGTISETKFDNKGWHITDWFLEIVPTTINGVSKDLLCDIVQWKLGDTETKATTRHGYPHY